MNLSFDNPSVRRLLFFFPKDLSGDDIRLLLLLGAAFVIGHYDLTILTLAVPDVQASFAVAESDLGEMIALIRLGALPAIFLALLADRIGRRQLLLGTLVGMSIFSLATCFAQTPNQFVLFQALVRFFGSLEEMLAVVYALEMLPARHRGWGVGFLAAVGGIGVGIGSVLYAFVDVLPGGWRFMYGFGGVAILFVAWVRKDLPESKMFAEAVHARGDSLLRPLREIFTQHRRALFALAVVSCAFWFQITASINFMSKYLQDVHDYSTLQVSVLFIIAGVIAVIGNLAAGYVSDIVGRRPTLALGVVVNFVATLVFYNASGIWLPLAWAALLFSFLVVDLISYALAGELFPTTCRSTAVTLRLIFTVLAAAAGLAVEGSLYSTVGSHSSALTLMTFSSLVALPAVFFWLRETANTRLS